MATEGTLLERFARFLFNSLKGEGKRVEKLPCIECGAMIVPTTAARNDGLCEPCKNGFRAICTVCGRPGAPVAELENQTVLFRLLPAEIKR